MLSKLPRCTMVSANEGTRTRASTIGITVNPAPQSNICSDKLHLEQLRCHCKQIYYD